MPTLPSPLRWIGPRTLAAVAALVVLELALYHLGDYGKWVVQEQSARFGWQMLPDQRGWSRHYDVEERINAQGFRDERDWPRPAARTAGPAAEDAPRRDPTLLRIGVVGNSMTYGTSVPVEQTWPRVLEARIAAHLAAAGDPRRVLVMNAAVQGYTFEQMARVYEDHLRPYGLDLLLWPLIAPDVRPMRPARDDVDYRFRRTVIRTATYDFLRRVVIDRWIPPPRRAPREQTAASLREQLWTSVAPALRAALERELGPEPGAARWTQLEPRLRAALDAAAPEEQVESLFRAVRTGLTTDGEPAGERASSRTALLACWTALEAALPEDRWAELDDAVKRTPFRERLRFLWVARGERLSALAADLAAGGGRLALFALPTMPRLVVGSPSPLGFWEGQWLPAARERGLQPAVFDTQEPFLGPMSTVLGEIERRGFVDGPRGEDWIGADYAGAGASLFLLTDTGHYNAAGHALLAETVFAELRDRGWLAPPEQSR
jgi:hypothetical protein